MEITRRRKDVTGLLRTFLLFVFEEGFSLNGASRRRQSQRRWAHLALTEAPPAAPSSAVPGGITDALGKETASSSRHVHCVSSSPVQNTLSPGASSTKHQPKDQSTENSTWHQQRVKPRAGPFLARGLYSRPGHRPWSWLCPSSRSLGRCTADLCFPSPAAGWPCPQAEPGTLRRSLCIPLLLGMITL